MRLGDQFPRGVAPGNILHFSHQVATILSWYPPRNSIFKNCIWSKTAFWTTFTETFWLHLKIPSLTGAPPPGWGEEPRGEGGAEEEEGEHDAADDRHGAEAQHHLRQLLQGSARESLREQVHVNHYNNTCLIFRHMWNIITLLKYFDSMVAITDYTDYIRWLN